jgi:hypothetical protein
VAASNPAYISLNGVLFDINETKLLQYPPASTNESYSIPGSVTTICDGAFGGCTSLTSVTVPNSVTAIESVAFADCPSLTAIYFQGNASSAETSVFDGDTNATAYYLPGTSGWGATYLGIPAMMLVPDSLLVTIAPSGAVSAGAHWQVDNGAWQNSGATVTNLSVGNHKVSFSTVPGWTTPTNQTVSISVNSMATAISIYGAQTGSLQVSISPVSAPPVGAQWQVDGGVWQNSGATVANLSVGNHTISFSTITGWTTPTNQIVTINGGITTATGLYASQTITILHSFNGFNDGSSPNSVILSGNTLYGTTDGLLAYGGTVFKVNTDGTGFTNLYSFSNSNGGLPNGVILSKDTVVWQSGETLLKVVYPSFSENVEASRPNETSAVLCLFHKDKIKIVWSGDAPMQVVGEKCADSLPHLLHGPHHGGPIDRKKPDFKEHIEKLTPEKVFVSVGTSNSYNLPSGDYLKLQASRGCRVICTQLTKLCDNRRQTPVLQTALLLGLRSPRRGLSCRGCMRLIMMGDSIVSDAWDAEHLNRIQSLRRPKCLMRN